VGVSTEPYWSAPYYERHTREHTTRQTMYVLRNIEGSSYNHCCHAKPIWITHAECVFVALVIEYAMRMRHTILSCVACPTIAIFSTHCRIKRHDFRIKMTLNTKCVSFIPSTTFVSNISHSKKNSASCDQKRAPVFTLNTRHYCHNVMKTEFSRQIFEKYRNIKFNEDPFIGNRDRCHMRSQRRTDGQT